MTFPVGGDFTRDTTNTFNVLKADRRICQHDNGTDVCDLGYKLKFPGTCLNQFLGTFNSTDPTFQPTFPICTVDFQSSGFASGTVLSKQLNSGSALSANLLGAIASDTFQAAFAQSAIGIFYSINLSEIIDDSYTVAKLDVGVLSSAFLQSVPSGVSSFWLSPQFNSGFLPRFQNTFSDLYYLDVTSYAISYNRMALHVLQQTFGKLKHSDTLNSFGNLVSTDYYTTITGSVDICEGDEEPPFITYVDPPASGTRLRGVNQAVEFKLADPLSGVDLSTVDVYLNSVTTGTIQLLTLGVDQTGGLVSITGDSSSYDFRYVPDYTWQTNDYVVVTISGGDLAPTVMGNPFFCEGNDVNYFAGDLWFTVAEEYNLPASLTAIGDIEPPYLYSVTPASGTGSNNIFSPIEIQIADVLTGVQLSSLNIVVAGVPIVVNGVPQTEETVVTGSSPKYTVTYTKSTAFAYGSTVNVQVGAADKVSPTPNSLNTAYNINYIDDSTLILENLQPPVGTSVNLDKVNISVDIRDDSHDINIGQTFLVVNNSVVSGTVTTLTSGINITYHPPNDFAFDEPIIVKIHAVNDNTASPAVKEAVYTLYYGCRVQLFSNEEYAHEREVEVLVKARNNENLFRDLTTGYFFTTYTQPSSDFGASIQAINPVSDLSASLAPQGPFHRYGEEVTVSFYVKDLEGRELGPYVYTYTIEENPN